MMKYLGLDLGSKTLGIAISDASNTIASVLKTIRFSDEDYQSLILACDKVNQYLRSQLGQTCHIIGPTMPYVGRLNQRFRMYFMIKYKREPRLHEILDQLLRYFSEDVVNLSLDYYPNQFN